MAKSLRYKWTFTSRFRKQAFGWRGSSTAIQRVKEAVAEIKAAGKEILPHLGQLSPITGAMTSEEKHAVIQAEFDRLYDPRHPVRNHLETLDSVEVVKTIREALKR
jgi:hypothetical protein